jgi:hypothetical protein
MTVEGVLNTILAGLIAMGLLNAYFLWFSFKLYRAVHPRSPILLALAGVSTMVWLIGVYIAVIAGRTLLGLPPLPFAGIGVGIGILLLEALPAFIWWQMRRFVSDDHDREP